MTKPKYWMGSTPSKCELCEQSFEEKMIDGKTMMGPWGLMCPVCYATYGVGLGTGKGQLYAKQANGRWLKVAG